MKKKMLPIFMCLLLCISVVFCACGGADGKVEKNEVSPMGQEQTSPENIKEGSPVVDETPLTADEALSIRMAYREILKSENFTEEQIPFESIKIRHYYGSYDGVRVVIIDCDRLDSVALYPEYTVGGYVFEGVQRSYFMCYKDGEMLWLGEAYENGWLDKDDIKTINETHRKLYTHYYS